MLDIIIKILTIIGIAIVAIIIIVAIAKIYNKIVWESRNRRRMAIIASQKEDAKTILPNNFIDMSDKIYTGASQILGTRSTQQDAYYVSDSVEFDLIKNSYCVAAVCDGMGGLASGEVASNMAKDIIKKSFDAFVKNPKATTIPEFLKSIAVNANNAVNDYSKNQCGGKMCGTTLAMAMAENNYLYWLGIGDSRIYIIRKGQIVQITNDHNYSYLLDQKVKEGLMTQQEALNEDKREALISYIGIDYLDIIDLSTNPIRLEKGDVVLVCSDGVTKVMSDNEILKFVIEHSEDAQELARLLPIEAFERNMGNHDNTTVAIMKYV